MVEKALNISLNNISVFPELEVKTQVVDRIFRTPKGSVTIAIVQKVRLEDG